MSLDHEPKNEMMCHELEPWALTPFCVNMGSGFKRDFPKIHDNVDVVRVTNEMKPCGVKNLSSTLPFQHTTYICLSKYITDKRKNI